MCLLPPSSVLSASMIQRAFWRAQRTHNAYSALEHAHQAQNPPGSNALTLLSANFPIGSHVTVVSSHPKYANSIGVVTHHTTKFVTFSPVDSPQDRIRILPQSLILVPPPAVVPPKPRNSRTTQRRVALLDTKDDQSQTQGRERNNDAYDKLPETVKFHVADGYVSFTRTFRYLGSLINYSLRDDDDITARIASRALSGLHAYLASGTIAHPTSVFEKCLPHYWTRALTSASAVTSNFWSTSSKSHHFLSQWLSPVMLPPSMTWHQGELRFLLTSINIAAYCNCASSS